MNFATPDIEVRGTATSGVTRELVETRLAELKQLPESRKTREQIAYLERIRERKGWNR